MFYLVLFYAMIVSLLHESQQTGNQYIIKRTEQTQIHQLQLDIQDLKSKVADITDRVSHQELYISDLTSNLTAEILATSGMASQVSDLNSKYTSQQASIGQLERFVQSTGSGAMYTIWGRKSCPANGTTTVYPGFAGGSYYSNAGGAADFLCMPTDPLWEPDAAKVGSAYVYGTEYEYDFFGNVRVNDDVPCSVCRVSTRSSVMMLPGRNLCYDGWTMEYHGWLAAGGAGDASATQYICLDKHPEATFHGMDDQNGRHLYVVNSQCGSLPCPPYLPGQSLSCVVCSI